jgi:isopentenyl phosphate kinase
MGLYVIKLGGSLITDKERDSTARRDVVARLAREIAAARARLPHALLLSHGSGSFGHAAPARYGLRDGVRDSAQLRGVAVTQHRRTGSIAW